MGIVANTRGLSAAVTGLQRYTLELLCRFGSEVELVTPSNWIDGIKGHLWEQTVLPTKLNMQLLWSPCNSGPLAIKRQVVTIHDVVPIDHPEFTNPKFAIWYRWLIPKLARRVRHIVTISEFTKERIVEITGISPEKITVIPNGVDRRFTRRASDENEKVRKALDIPTPYYVLSLGAIDPRKNLHRLIFAWNQLYKKLPNDVWLVIVGSKRKFLEYKEFSLSHLPPRVHLTGYVKDDYLPPLYSGALTFVFPSVYEGFGLPPLEAMACGTPVITGNRTALPEVVGDAGVMVDPYDVDAIADALFRIVEDSNLRQELRYKGLDRAKQFDWDRTAELTLQVLRSAAQI